jgi:hypothetical protein
LKFVDFHLQYLIEQDRIARNPERFEARFASGNERNGAFRQPEPARNDILKRGIGGAVLWNGANPRLERRTIARIGNPFNGVFGGFRREPKVRNDARVAVPPGFAPRRIVGRCAAQMTALAMLGMTTL